MEQEKEYTTIQIYRDDLQKVTDICNKNENLRDKLSEIIKESKLIDGNKK